MKRKIIIFSSIGAGTALAGTTGGLIYAFVFKDNAKKTNAKEIELKDIVSLNDFGSKFFQFSGYNGQGKVVFKQEQLKNKVKVKYTKVYSKQTNIQGNALRKQDFNLESKDINNLKNGDVFHAKFFVIESSGYHLDKKLQQAIKLEVKSLLDAPKTLVTTSLPKNLIQEVNQFDKLKTNFVPSQLYNKFQNMQKGENLSSKQLWLANENLFTLPKGFEVKYHFDHFGLTNQDKNLYLQVELVKTNNNEDFELINNKKVIKLNFSTNYAFVQKEIDKNVQNVFSTYSQNFKNDPNSFLSDPFGKVVIPKDFSLKDYYDYDLPKNLGSNIQIDSYEDILWNANEKKLKVKAKINDLFLPKGKTSTNNQVEISIFLFSEKDIPKTPNQAKDLFENISSLNDPLEINLNFSQAKNFFDASAKDQPFLYSKLNTPEIPLNKNLKAEYFLEQWLENEKLLKVKVQIHDVNDAKLARQETFIFLKPKNNLELETEKVMYYFFNQSSFSSYKTIFELSQIFSELNSLEEVDEQNVKDLIINYQRPNDLTKGIDMKFKYVNWDKDFKHLHLKIELQDTNSPLNEIAQNNELMVKINLIPLPIDLVKTMEQLVKLKSSYTPSQLYDKFQNMQKGDNLTSKELAIINKDLINLPQGVEIKYKFDHFGSFNQDKYLYLEVQLVKTNSNDDFEIINNIKTIKLNFSTDYEFVQNEINKNFKSIFSTYSENFKNDPNDFNKNVSGEIVIPSDFNLKNYYNYDLPITLGTNIKINKYKEILWDKSQSILTIKAEVNDLLLPKGFTLTSNEIEIKLFLFLEKNVPQTANQAKAFFENMSPENDPLEIGLNFSQVKSFFHLYRKGQQFSFSKLNVPELPLGKDLKAEYFLEQWLENKKLLKIKVQIQNTKVLSSPKLEAFVFIKPQNDLTAEVKKVKDYFFSKQYFLTSKTVNELNNQFAGLTTSSSINLQSLVNEIARPSNLTNGIEMEFKFKKWDPTFENLELEIELKDTNAPLNLPINNNKLEVKMKLIPSHDFTGDLNSFANEFTSSLLFSEIYNNFNEDTGLVAKSQGDLINPSSFGFTTPTLSKSTIEVKYELVKYDKVTKDLKVKVILTDKDVIFPIVTRNSVFKDFIVKGSTDLANEIKKINRKYTVFSQKDKSQMITDFTSRTPGSSFDFKAEFPHLEYQDPVLIKGINLNYTFQSFDQAKETITLQAILTDANALSTSTLINSTEDIIIQLIPAYNYASIVKEFNENVAKEIKTLNNSELYNLFYEENGDPKYQQGDIVNSQDFGYSPKFLLPTNIKTTYKFNGWDFDQNLLKIDVSLNNEALSDLIVSVKQDFTLEFFGSSDLTSEKQKIELTSNSVLEYETNLFVREQQAFLDKIPLNTKMTYKQVTTLFDEKAISWFNDLDHLLKQKGFDKLTNGIETFWTITKKEFTKGQNPVLTLKVELEDSKVNKNSQNTQNVIDPLQIKIVPKYDIDFLQDFLYTIGSFDGTKLEPKGLIDLSNVGGMISYEDAKSKHKWDGNIQRRYEIADFFDKFVGQYRYQNPNNWNLNTLFRKYNIIDPNTGKPFDGKDFYIRVNVRGFDDTKKLINVKLLFQLTAKAKQEYGFPPKIKGNTKDELIGTISFKLKAKPKSQ